MRSYDKEKKSQKEWLKAHVVMCQMPGKMTGEIERCPALS